MEKYFINMTTSQNAKFGDIAEVVMGQSPLGNTCNYSGKGVPLLNGPTEFGSRFPTPIQFTSDPKRKASKGDLLFCVRGSTTGRMNWADREYAIGRGLAAIRHSGGGELNPFLKGVIDNNLRKLLAQATGSTFPNISKDQLDELKVVLPAISIQKIIALILSSYDILIENSEQRINILKNMAQILYTEWFVKFKFPGHEKTRLVNSLPEGWEYKRIDDVARVIRGTSYSSEQINDDFGDYYLVNLKSFNRGGGFRYDGKKYFSGIINRDQLLSQGDIVVAVTDMTTDRAVIARPARIPHIKNQNVTFSADVVKIIPQKLPPTFTYYCLLDYRFTETTKNKANGANVLHLKPQAISEYKILIPNPDLMEKFEKLCVGIVNLIGKLSEKNENLNKVRDLLIPQLVTGRRELKQ